MSRRLHPGDHPDVGYGGEGAHVHYRNQAQDYLVDVYAPVDGTIVNKSICEDTCIAPNNCSGKRMNSVALQFASKDGFPLTLQVAFEPMIVNNNCTLNFSDADHYEDLVDVSTGQFVRKGQRIGRLYVPADPNFPNTNPAMDDTHIHFHINYSNPANAIPGPNPGDPAVQPSICPNFFENRISDDFGPDGLCIPDGISNINFFQHP